MLTSEQYSHKIKETREGLGITQRRAADLLEMSERNYIYYENGYRKISYWQFKGITEALKEDRHV